MGGLGGTFGGGLGGLPGLMFFDFFYWLLVLGFVPHLSILFAAHSRKLQSEDGGVLGGLRGTFGGRLGGLPCSIFFDFHRCLLISECSANLSIDLAAPSEKLTF